MVHIDISDFKRSFADIDLSKNKLLIGNQIAELGIESEIGVKTSNDEIILTKDGNFLFFWGIVTHWLHRHQWFLSSHHRVTVYHIASFYQRTNLGDVLDPLKLFDLEFPHLCFSFTKRQLCELYLAETHSYHLLLL